MLRIEPIEIQSSQLKPLYVMHLHKLWLAYCMAQKFYMEFNFMALWLVAEL